MELRTTLLLFIICLLFSCKSKEELDDPNIPSVIDIPIITTSEVSEISSFSFLLNGQVIDIGGSDLIEIGFVANESPGPSIENNIQKFEVESDSFENFNLRVINFPASTRYYIRAYGINSEGIGYGNEVEVLTPDEHVYLGNPVVLSTQEEVETFGANNYTRVATSITIENSVTDLSPLNSIIFIGGELDVLNTTDLVNFNGLENLKSIGGSIANGIRFENNLALQNFSGLLNVEELYGWFYITDNPVLETMEGFESLKYTGILELYVDQCPSLTNLSGLQGITDVFGNVIIRGNTILNDLTGLSNLQNIFNQLRIIDNPVLENLVGLEKLETVDAIQLIGNDDLHDISGFEALISIESSISLVNNSSLNQISVFDFVTELEFLTIEDNNTSINLSGLKNLTSLLSFEVNNNPLLVNLDAFENLNSIENRIEITENLNLDDFCALKQVFENEFNGFMDISENAENPTVEFVLTNCN